MKNKQYITIKDMARLKNMTAETLRYYDRIGLFKPEYVDPETKYRYYSLSQYERLGTIKELRQLDMSLQEIKDYFEDRNIEKSKEILTKQYQKLCTELDEMTVLKKALSKKLNYMNNMNQFIPDNEIKERYYEKRTCLSLGKKIGDVMEYAYIESMLENEFIEKAPILASNRVGSIISKEDFIKNHTQFDFIPMILCECDDVKNTDHMMSIPEGLYVSLLHHGRFGSFEADYYKLVKYYLDENGYEICGDIVHIYQIDITITGRNEERALEIQIPVTQKA